MREDNWEFAMSTERDAVNRTSNRWMREDHTSGVHLVIDIDGADARIWTTRRGGHQWRHGALEGFRK